MSSNLTYDRQKAAEAQEKWCESLGQPYFAPSDGFCFGCNRNIYDKVEWKNGCSAFQTHVTGISVEEAKSSLITRCPHCNKSFCD